MREQLDVLRQELQRNRSSSLAEGDRMRETVAKLQSEEEQLRDDVAQSEREADRLRRLLEESQATCRAAEKERQGMWKRLSQEQEARLKANEELGLLRTQFDMLAEEKRLEMARLRLEMKEKSDATASSIRASEEEKVEKLQAAADRERRRSMALENQVNELRASLKAQKSQEGKNLKKCA